jgi:hypothetical protein
LWAKKLQNLSAALQLAEFVFELCLQQFNTFKKMLMKPHGLIFGWDPETAESEGQQMMNSGIAKERQGRYSQIVKVMCLC